MSSRSGYIWGVLLLVIGALALMANLGLLNNLDWNYVWPLVLIVIGVWLLIVRAVPGGSGTRGGFDRSEPADGLGSARLHVALGAAKIELRSAPLGDLLFRAHVEHGGRAPEVRLDRSTGTLYIGHDGAWILGGWGRVRLDMQVSDSIPWALDIDSGAVKGTLNMAGGRVSSLESDAGSTRLELSLPKPSGVVPVRVDGGSVRVDLRRPSGVAVLVNTTGGSIRFFADGVRQSAFGAVSWSTPGAADAPDRYELRLNGGSVNLDLEQG